MAGRRHSGSGGSAGVRRRIASCYPRLSAAHKRVAGFVLEHTQRAAFMTVEALAAETGVSPATAFRFARALGYPGFPAFKDELATLLQESLRPVERLRAAQAEGPAVGPQAALAAVFDEDRRNLEETQRGLAPEQFARAAHLLRDAERIVVFGEGASAHLVALAGHRLGGLRPGVTHAEGGSRGIYQQLYWLGERDVLLVVSLPRYSRATVEACRFARSRGARVVAVTDRVTAPAYALATEALLVHTQRELLLTSLTAALAVLDALVTAVAAMDRERTLGAMADLTKQLVDVQEYALPAGDLPKATPKAPPKATPKETRRNKPR